MKTEETVFCDKAVEQTEVRDVYFNQLQRSGDGL